VKAFIADRIGMPFQNGELGRDGRGACLGEERKRGLWVVRPTDAEKHGYALSLWGLRPKYPSPVVLFGLKSHFVDTTTSHYGRSKQNAWGQAGSSEFYNGGHTLVRTADCNLLNSIHAFSSSPPSSCLFSSLSLSIPHYPTQPTDPTSTSQPRQFAMGVGEANVMA
jgi:hypothetical protein